MCALLTQIHYVVTVNINNNYRRPQSYSVLIVKVNSQCPVRVEKNACEDTNENEHDLATGLCKKKQCYKKWWRALVGTVRDFRVP
jgi:hypothetical protein